MAKEKTEYCGYEYDPELSDELQRHQSCCVREVLSDKNKCVWHADPDETDEKTVEALKQARVSSEDTELLDGAVLRGMRLGNKISFNGVPLREADLRDVDLCGADMSDANLGSADLQGADFREANLCDAVLGNADLRDACLSGANLRDAWLSGADLRESVLRVADLRADFEDADMSNADLGYADLRDANLNHTDLSDTNLSNADLSDAYLSGAGLHDADLRGANLCDAILRGADLSGANLDDTDLSGTRIKHARLNRASLLNADLTGARLYGTLFGDARINRATEFWQDGQHYCYYDHRYEGNGDKDEEDTDLEKAAEVYTSIETLARDNSIPELATESFLGRKDVQRQQYWKESDYLMWGRSKVPSIIARYGESIGRVVLAGGSIVFVCGLLYWGGRICRARCDGRPGEFFREHVF